MSRTVMAKYGELFLKSESVQKYYTKLLTKNIRSALNAENLTADIIFHRGRVLIGDDSKGDDLEEVMKVVLRVFGIVDAAIAEVTKNDMDSIAAAAAALAKPKLHEGMSFAVRARRSNIKDFTSQELGAYCGDRVYDTTPNLSVNLRNPDYQVYVEARREGGLVYDELSAGPGGLPSGTQGRVLSLLSAGIDSPVAAWLMMKRGCTVSHVHFNGGEFMGRDTLKGALENLAALSKWTCGNNHDMYFADLTPFYRELIKLDRIKNRCLVCKRFMLRCASGIVKNYGYGGIVMGNNLGQVASQTLANMSVVGSALDGSVPLFQPLLTFDKEETVTIARRIGTFRENAGDLGCSVVPKHPAISGNMADVLEDESQLDLAGLEKECMEHIIRYRAVNGIISEKEVRPHRHEEEQDE